jgi:hypothetical protein
VNEARISVIAVAVFALLANGTGAPVFADVGASARPAPLALNDCSTAQLGNVIGVYLVTPAPRATPVPFPSGVKTYLAYVLQHRLTRCAAMLPGHGRHRGSASAACTPTSNENDVRHLWTQLEFCVALANRTSDPPGTQAIPWQLPAQAGTGNRPVIFVLGIGDDKAMVGKLVSTLTVYLNDGREESGYYFDSGAVLVPEPSWSPADYAAQCEGSPNVRGAIVVDITAAGSGAADEFIRRRNWSAIEATALYAACNRSTPSSHGSPAYVWVSDIAMKQNQRITLTPLTPLAMLLMLGAAYEEFAPSRTTSTTTTRTLPNPTPIPKSGRVTQISTTNAQTLNAAGLSSVAGSFLGSAISYTNTVAPLTQSPTVDQQTWDTLQSVAIALVRNMNCWQPAPAAIEAPNAQDIVGAARALPAYNPPAGLGAYSSGAPSAPFCSEPAASESIDDILP